MSEHSEAHSNKRNKSNAETATIKEDTQMANTETSIDTETVTIEIAGISVALPVKFKTGHALTANQAKVLDVAYQRQFKNNQDANAKARSERLAKATDEEEIEANLPLTADDYVDFYLTYEPQTGSGPRTGSLEKMRLDAAWKAWVQLVKEHNDSIKEGGEAIITKAGNKAVVAWNTPRKVRGEDADGFAKKLEASYQARKLFLDKFLSMPEYADRIQMQIDALLAEKNADKAVSKSDNVVEAGAALL